MEDMQAKERSFFVRVWTTFFEISSFIVNVWFIAAFVAFFLDVMFTQIGPTFPTKWRTLGVMDHGLIKYVNRELHIFAVGSLALIMLLIVPFDILVVGPIQRKINGRRNAEGQDDSLFGISDSHPSRNRASSDVKEEPNHDAS